MNKLQQVLIKLLFLPFKKNCSKNSLPWVTMFSHVWMCLTLQDLDFAITMASDALPHHHTTSILLIMKSNIFFKVHLAINISKTIQGSAEINKNVWQGLPRYCCIPWVRILQPRGYTYCAHSHVEIAKWCHGSRMKSGSKVFNITTRGPDSVERCQLIWAEILYLLNKLDDNKTIISLQSKFLQWWDNIFLMNQSQQPI